MSMQGMERSTCKGLTLGDSGVYTCLYTVSDEGQNQVHQLHVLRFLAHMLSEHCSQPSTHPTIEITYSAMSRFSSWSMIE